MVGNSTGTTLINKNPYLYRGYRYDRELGLYYLNSRYYDPETGRFINADMFVSTGQGILGSNMYAYCLNDPVNSNDPSGADPFGILTWIDKAIIHLMVQIKCAIENVWAKEVYVKGEQGKGFVDLLDPINREYYEIKSEKGIKDSRTFRQIDKYENAKIQSSWGNNFKTPAVPIGATITAGKKEIEGDFHYGIYDIEYHLVQPGLIGYFIEPNWERAAAIASAEVIALLTIAFPAAAPALIPSLVP